MATSQGKAAKFLQVPGRSTPQAQIVKVFTDETKTISLRLVSVIMPTYNCGRYIGEAIDSLRAQSYATWECIVVDDGSTDDTKGIVTRIAARDPRISYVHQTNRGQSAARNTG